MFEEPKQKPKSLENRASLGIPPYGNGWPGIKVRWCTGQLKTHLISKEVNRLKGELGALHYPAFGYKRDPADKHHLIIDEDTAPIVRRIFSMRASGLGFRKIATMLNEEGIQPPGVLYYQRKGQSDPRRGNHQWADTTVKAIIRNEVYIGNMVQGKTGTMSYKSRKLIAKPEDEWIRVEGTHEAIINREMWDTVANIDKNKVRKRDAADGVRSIFSGLIYCADCGFKMRSQVERFTYYKEALLQPMWIDPVELARRMKLTVLRHRISEDMTVFGQIQAALRRIQVPSHDEGGVPVRQ